VNTSSLVVLKGGLVLPLDALLLAWELESRGFKFEPDGNGGLLVGPRAQLTESDRIAIRHWKLHLAAISTYEAPDVI
jgi:hypothetical protein